MIKFHYFGDRSKAFSNVITVASNYDIETNTLYMGVAFSSKEDRYDKEAGRQLAAERLENKQYKVAFHEPFQRSYSIFHEIVKTTILRREVAQPSWAKSIVDN